MSIEWIGFLAAILTTGAYIPQVLKMENQNSRWSLFVDVLGHVDRCFFVGNLWHTY